MQSSVIVTSNLRHSDIRLTTILDNLFSVEAKSSINEERLCEWLSEM